MPSSGGAVKITGGGKRPEFVAAAQLDWQVSFGLSSEDFHRICS